MKVLQVIPFFTPNLGGPVAYTEMVSKNLARHGHEVTIITSDYMEDMLFRSNMEDYGIEVISFPCIMNIGLYLYTPDIKKWSEKNLQKYDIIHMQQYRAYQNDIIRKYALKFHVPYIIQAHGSVLSFFSKQWVKNFYDFIFGFKQLRDASQVIALTETEKDQYLQMRVPEKKITIIPNGIDLSSTTPLPVKGIFKHKYNIPDDERLVLFLGRIHKIKGIELLVEAFSLITKEIPDIRLVIAGPDGGDKKNVMKSLFEYNLTEKVLFVGPLYGAEKVSAYVDADVYVLPSIYDAFPTTVLESWACGTPVIITESCALSPAIVKEQAGIVVNRDPFELSYAIHCALEEAKMRDQIIARGRALVEGEYNIEQVVRGLEGCYQSAFGGSKNNVEVLNSPNSGGRLWG